ncbi:hypothetical protein ACJO5Y_11465 [Marinobacter sp. GN3S48]|uniref:hypothetical protein n=1 Tax=Marinobacter sp. GN3S48 TaxID=3382302 RepID=UPI00387B8762
MAERFRIGLPEIAFPFIPPADKFLEYTGIPGGIAGVINALGANVDQPLPDPKTIRRAVKEGVLPRSAKKIKDALESVLSTEMRDYITSSHLAPWVETTLHHNGLAWLCIVKGHHLRIFQADQPETFTERFIKRRAEQEIQILEAGLEIQKSSTTTAVFEGRWWETLNDFLPRFTGVDAAYIEQGLQAVAALKSNTDQSRHNQVGQLLGLYTRLRIDFYYQLLCSVSLDLICWLKEEDTIGSQEIHWLIENSIFGDMVPTFDGTNLTLPFERLLDTWRQGAEADGKDLSWAKIAEHLPDPYGLDANTSRARDQTVEARAAAIRKNKKSRLREWRSGTRPNPDQLKQFIRNLVQDDKDVSLATMRAEVASTWGAFLLDEVAVFEKYRLFNALHETLPAFECFPTYWADCQSQAAQILAA